MNSSHERIHQATIAWAKQYYGTDEIICHIFDDEDDDPSRYIVIIAVRGLDTWQAVEVWEEGGAIVSINHLGEGIPSEDAVWPWPDD